MKVWSLARAGVYRQVLSDFHVVDTRPVASRPSVDDQVSPDTDLLPIADSDIQFVVATAERDSQIVDLAAKNEHAVGFIVDLRVSAPNRRAGDLVKARARLPNLYGIPEVVPFDDQIAPRSRDLHVAGHESA